MEEQEMITIRCYDATTNTYYDKQVPYTYDLDKGKNDRIAELETFINDYRNNGIEWNGQVWAIDKTCEENLTSQITYLSFAPTESVSWFSKSQVNILTIDEFKELALILSSAIANAKMKYYTYKNAIENASSKEELDAIVFEQENTQDNIQE